MSGYNLGELTRTLFEESGDALFLKDTRLRIIAANRRFCEAVGRCEADILGKTDLDFYPQALAEKYRADDRRVLAEGRRLEREEQTLIAGQLRRVRVSRTPVRDSADHIVGVLGIFCLVTEQHALEEQLRQAQKMEAVGQLAGGVAHDFNNLLTAILGNLSLLQKALSRDNPHRLLIDAAERAAWRAATLTRQLLGFSRRTVIHPEPLNANHTVAEVVGLINRTIDPRIRLQTRTVADLWPVMADPCQMSQVLLNLCLNARDAVQALLDGTLTPSSSLPPCGGGLGWGVEPLPPPQPSPTRGEGAGKPPPETASILLETANVVRSPDDVGGPVQCRLGEFVRLRVSDNGTGISAHEREHIFEPFFTTKEPGKGTGLGLAMVFGIVQQHHGWIECHSTPGQGTRFDIYLPRHHAPRASDPASSAPRVPSGGHETILFVDDEALVRNLGRSILESYGYRVLLANDGQDAVELYRRERHRINLIVLDLTMPRLCGRDALRRLRAIDPQVRIMYASGYTVEHLSAEDHEHICGFISKPYRPEALAQVVRTALDRPRPPSKAPEAVALILNAE